MVEGVEVVVPLRGSHNLRNAMLAIAAARASGVSVADAARGIGAMLATPMRSNLERLGALTLINDAYNANPGSTRAALELLSHAGRGKQRVAILGSMLVVILIVGPIHERCWIRASSSSARWVSSARRSSVWRRGKLASSRRRIPMACGPDCRRASHPTRLSS